MKTSILILEDNPIKISAIQDALVESTTYDIDSASNIADMKKKMLSGRYDILIVDMHIPESKRGDIDQEGGIKAINYIRTTTDVIYRPHGIIILSEYAQSDDLLRQLHQRGYCYPIIDYSSDDSWKRTLNEQIEYSINLSGRRADIVIAVAVDVELDGVLSALNWEEFTIHGDDITYYSTQLINEKKERIYTVVLCKAKKMGPIPAAVMVTKAVHQFMPDHVFMIGISAGKPRTTNTCDVLIASVAGDYSYGKVEDTGTTDEFTFFARSTNENIDQSIQHVFEQYSKDKDKKAQTYYQHETMKLLPPNEYEVIAAIQQSKIRVGKIVSGPCVVKSTRFKQIFILPTHDDYYGIDMESYSLYYAAVHANHKVKYMSIKAISDMGDPAKSDTYQLACVLESFNLLRYYICNDID